MKRILCVAAFAIASLIAGASEVGSQEGEGGKVGQGDSASTTQLERTSAIGWVLFSHLQPSEDGMIVEHASVTVVAQSTTGTKPSWQVPLVVVRAGLWALPELALHKCHIDCVTLVGRTQAGPVLASFRKKVWSSKNVNALDAQDTAKEDVSLSGDEIVYRRFWVTASAAGSDFSPGESDLVQFYLPDGWRVGSSGWLPMAKVGPQEFIAMVGMYQSATGKTGGAVRSLRLRSTDAAGVVIEEATVPITCTEYALSQP